MLKRVRRCARSLEPSLNNGMRIIALSEQTINPYNRRLVRSDYVGPDKIRLSFQWVFIWQKYPQWFSLCSFIRKRYARAYAIGGASRLYSRCHLPVIHEPLIVKTEKLLRCWLQMVRSLFAYWRSKFAELRGCKVCSEQTSIRADWAGERKSVSE